MIELAIVSVAIDVIGSAAALGNTIKGAESEPVTYEAGAVFVASECELESCDGSQPAKCHRQGVAMEQGNAEERQAEQDEVDLDTAHVIDPAGWSLVCVGTLFSPVLAFSP